MSGERGLVARLAKMLGALVAAWTAWRTARDRPTAPDDGEGAPAAQEDPSERRVPSDRRAESIVIVLLLAAAALGFGSVALYIVLPLDAQPLGLGIGGCLALLAAAAIIAGKLVVPQETAVQERDELLERAQLDDVLKVVRCGGEGISRRGLLAGAGGLAGAALASALAAPVASLGPTAGSLHASPWRMGVRMVDDQGRPLSAASILIGTFYTALPEGESWESLGAGVLVVRLPTSMIHLPASRRAWVPEGIMAFSKICTHAGCAISLYRYPTSGSTSVATPAFTCPCHYSTFTPGDGGQVTFGPAGRPLPQLPVMIDGDGNLRAAGNFDQDVGPSWWGVRRA